jgi:membrane protein DedA with SNARE-associated domain
MLETAITHYGYLAVLVGTFFEGETILIAAGFAASRGYLDLFGVIVAAFVGTFAGDQLFFFLGRRHSGRILSRFARFRQRAERVNDLLVRYQNVIIVGFRFAYGLRTVTPFVVGMSHVKTSRFVVLNIMGGLVWAIAVAVCGFLAGQALEAILGDLRQYERVALVVILLIGLGLAALHWCRQRRVRG